MRFAVRDCGTGIPPEIIDRLFEPFVTTKSDGLGLGLSISRTIVTAHGGRLWAENNVDGGATLYCVLPVMDPCALLPAREPPAARRRSGRIGVTPSAMVASPRSILGGGIELRSAVGNAIRESRGTRYAFA